MATVTIGQLPANVNPINGGDLIAIVSNGVTSRTSVANLSTALNISSNLSIGGRTGSINIPIAGQQFNVLGRNGNIVINA